MGLKEIKILAIETSCDETAVAIIAIKNDQPVILSNIVASQINLHKETGGVVPEVASRAHMEAMIPVITEALRKANLSGGDDKADSLLQITHLAVTAGPGLIGSLLVGFNTAKALAYALNLPIVPINHIEGHIYSALAAGKSDNSNNLRKKAGYHSNEIKIEFPILALTVSGGHTSLTLIRNFGVYNTIGQTRDDAAGEAFDKVAKLLALGYPGGPIVSRLADRYRRKNPDYQMADKASEAILLPRPMIREKNFDFSFSGLKTAVIDVVNKLTDRKSKRLTNEQKLQISAAFEDAVVDVLVTKTVRAAGKYQPKAVILAGGVAANKQLREVLSDKLQANSYNLFLPPAELCGDNAAMIGLAAYYHIIRGDENSWDKIKINSNLKL